MSRPEHVHDFRGSPPHCTFPGCLSTPPSSTPTPDATERPDVPRPWCLPCAELGTRVPATEYGIACEWHVGILSDRDREALRLAVLDRHPRGGRVKKVIEQIWVLRVTLRQGSTGRNNVEAIWQADAEEMMARDNDDDDAAMAAERKRLALVNARD